MNPAHLGIGAAALIVGYIVTRIVMRIVHKLRIDRDRELDERTAHAARTKGEVPDA